MIFAFVAVFLFGYYISKSPQQLVVGQSSVITALTQTSVTVSSTPTLISSGDLQGYRIFANTGATNTAYLFFKATTTGITSSTATKGIPVTAGTKYEVTSQNYMTGPAYVILASGTTTISVGQ